MALREAPETLDAPDRPRADGAAAADRREKGRRTPAAHGRSFA
jgi:hypothetical protein